MGKRYITEDDPQEILDPDQNPEEVMIPVWTKGMVNLVDRKEGRVYVETPNLKVPMGMCGGKILSLA